MDYYTQIEDYLNNKLTADQRAAFEQAMAEDEVLQVTVEKFYALEDTLERQARDEAYKAVVAARKDFEATPAILRRVRARRPLAIAASVLVIVLGIAAILANTSYSNKQLAESFHEFPMDLMTNQSGDDAVQQPIQLVRNEWNDGNRDRAIAQAEAYVEMHPDDARFHYLLAHMYFENGEFAKAKQAFTSLDSDVRFRDEADFMVALCDLRLGDDNEAIVKLSEIRDNKDNTMSDESASLLKKLGSPLRVLTFD